MVRPRDTSAEAHERQLAILRSMTPAQRLRLADEMSNDIRSLATAGIRQRQPGSSEEQHLDAEAEILLGRTLAAERRRSSSRAR